MSSGSPLLVGSVIITSLIRETHPHEPDHTMDCSLLAVDRSMEGGPPLETMNNISPEVKSHLSSLFQIDGIEFSSICLLPVSFILNNI